jgi:flagellar biosynthetic protein FlhB
MSGEKTEEPTHHKLQKAREKGQVSKSQDFVSLVGFAISFATLAAVLPLMTKQISSLFDDVFAAVGQHNLNQVMPSITDRCFQVLLLASLPVLLAAMVAGILGNFAQIGFLFTTETVVPKFEKLNPIQGLKQLFSWKRQLEVLKQLLKFFLVAVVVYDSVKDALRQIVLMPSLGIAASMQIAGGIFAQIFLEVGIVFLVIAIADFFLQKRIFKKSMMMTHDEVKREYKESEGDPEMKGERKRLAHELVMQGDPARVKKADVVITNPSHIAVALEYSEATGSAPVIAARGMGLYAEQIKEIAKSHHVPLVRNIPLAQALSRLEIDDEIPEDLYQAVAEVLSFVHELKKW